MPEVVLENLLQPLHPLPVKDVLDVQVVDLKVHLGHGDGIDEDHTYNDHQNEVSQFGLSRTMNYYQRHINHGNHLKILIVRLLHIDLHVKQPGLESVPVSDNHLGYKMIKLVDDTSDKSLPS